MLGLWLPARIYFKDESVSPAGSHKPNTAVPQAFYNKQEGISRLSTETGAGQWGTALAFACSQFDLDLQVYMVRASYEQKPYRRIAIETWGGSVVPSPVDEPEHPGSLGTAISDAVRDCVGRADTHYALGSVLNHVLLHQTVIGLEAREQLRLAGERLPDVVIAPCGGGSNLGGIAFPFVPDADVRLVAVEHPVQLDLRPSGGPWLRLKGRVDRLEVDREGRPVVVDVKTGKTAPSKQAVTDHPQLAVYQLAAALGAFGDVIDRAAGPGGARLVYVADRLAAGTPKEPAQEPLDEDGVAHWRTVVVGCAEDTSGARFVARTGPDCDRCPVRTSCPLHDAGRPVPEG